MRRPVSQPNGYAPASVSSTAPPIEKVPRRYLTNDEAAAFLRLSPRTLEKLRVIGGGPRFRKFGRRVMYAVEDLKVLRKKNVSVVFATQSLADVQQSAIAPAIIESCASRIFLPNPQAMEPQIRTIYEGFGLNSRQIELVATAQPTRDYYYRSRVGNRLFDLDLGPIALAFAGAPTPADQRDIDRVLADAGVPGFAGAWLRERGLGWAADLLSQAPAVRAGATSPDPEIVS